MIQQVIAFGLLLAAVVFLLRKFVFRPRKKNDGCGPDCGCD